MTEFLSKAVLPVAGWGTRWLPVTRCVPKELLPVGDLPLIHHVVREAKESSFRNFLFIYSPGKESILEYFQPNAELDAYLEKKGKSEVMDEWRDLVDGIQYQGAVQEDAKGLGHAVFQARDFIDEKPFAVLLPDDLIFSRKPCIRQLADAHARFGGAILALERVPRDRISNYGVIDGEEMEAGIYRVNRLVEKPTPEQAPSDLAVIGRYILPYDIFHALEDLPPGAGGEIQLTDAIARLIPDPGVLGVVFEGTRYDAGKPPGWLTTNLAYFSSSQKFLSKAALQSLFQKIL